MRSKGLWEGQGRNHGGRGGIEARTDRLPLLMPYLASPSGTINQLWAKKSKSSHPSLPLQFPTSSPITLPSPHPIHPPPPRHLHRAHHSCGTGQCGMMGDNSKQGMAFPLLGRGKPRVGAGADAWTEAGRSQEQ